MTNVEMISEIIANGAALKTKSKFFNKVNKANPNIKINLKGFSERNKSPEIRFKIPNIYVNTS